MLEPLYVKNCRGDHVLYYDVRCSQHVKDVDCGHRELDSISFKMYCDADSSDYFCGLEADHGPWYLKEIIIRDNNAQATYRIISDRVIKRKLIQFWGTCILHR